MDKLFEFFAGKKTFIVAVLVAVGAGITAFTQIEIPEAAWAILAALGLAAVRAGVEKNGPTE